MGGAILPDKICKIVRQHSRGKLPPEDMEKLQEIAEDYRKVKNYVYQRYGGIRSLSKIYPGYTVQNEMTDSGLRGQLDMPSVYFYLAVFDALGDIKSQWSQVKGRILKGINQNEHLTPEERHYLRFVMRVSSLFEAVLCGYRGGVPKAMERQYEALIAQADIKKLDRYLCRQVRKRLRKLHTEKAGGFSIAERAYRYGDQGLYISTKESRKRIFVPLTDRNSYKKQLYIKLFPQEGRIEIDIPLEVKVRRNKEFNRIVGLSPGMWRLFTTDGGKAYGVDFGQLHQDLAEFIGSGNRVYAKEKKNNPGRQKYRAGKARLEAKMHTYINQEINRMLEEEKPERIYLPRLPQTSCAGRYGKVNYSVTIWQRGYVRKRLQQKCLEQGIHLIEVFGSNISRECSQCGSMGACEKDTFICGFCGYETEKKKNAAVNAKKRGELGQWVRKEFVEENPKERDKRSVADK